MPSRSGRERDFRAPPARLRGTPRSTPPVDTTLPTTTEQPDTVNLIVYSDSTRPNTRNTSLVYQANEGLHALADLVIATDIRSVGALRETYI
jgi:hypothetical protein